MRLLSRQGLAALGAGEEQQRVDDRFASVQNGGPAAVADDTIRRWFTKDYQRRNPDVVRKWKSKILSNDPDHYRRAYQLFCKADLEFRDSLCRISAPTLIVTGDNDVGQTPRMVREMAKRIPNSRTEITGGVAHMYPIEAADTLTKLISQFTRQCIA